MTAVTFFGPNVASLLSFPVFLGVALALLLAMEFGYRIGRWHQKIGRGSIKEFVGIIDAPILVLHALLYGQKLKAEIHPTVQWHDPSDQSLVSFSRGHLLQA